MTTHRCERCQGVLTPTRRISLEQMMATHLASCPSLPPKVRRNPPPPEPPQPPEPPPVRKRIIPRTIAPPRSTR